VIPVGHVKDFVGTHPVQSISIDWISWSYNSFRLSKLVWITLKGHLRKSERASGGEVIWRPNIAPDLRKWEIAEHEITGTFDIAPTPWIGLALIAKDYKMADQDGDDALNAYARLKHTGRVLGNVPASIWPRFELEILGAHQNGPRRQFNRSQS